MKNQERVLVQCVKEAAARWGISLEMLCDDWVLVLERSGRRRFVVGYDFDLNSCAAQQVARDKVALSDVLGRVGVPRVEHRLAHHPKMSEYVAHTGNWAWLSQWLAACGTLVLKPNEGTGGTDVLKVSTLLELENALQSLHAKTRTVAVSQFIEIEHEYRIITLNESVLLCYEKVRSTVTGDGYRTLAQLWMAHIMDKPSPESVRQVPHMPWGDVSLQCIPPAGKECVINWRHNLGQGATVRLLATSEAQRLGLIQLALRAAQAINLRFGSVDLVTLAGEVKVLEINSGVMMESLARQLPNGMDLARNVYQNAVKYMFI